MSVFLAPKSFSMRYGMGVLLACACHLPVYAQGLFEDRDARLAILEMRKQIESLESNQNEVLANLQKLNQRLTDSNPQQGLLELVQQNQELRREINVLRGMVEQIQARTHQLEHLSTAKSSPITQITDQLKALQSDFKLSLDNFSDRLNKLEPYAVEINGKRYWVTASESEAFNASMERVKAQDWTGALEGLNEWIERYGSKPPYASNAEYWRANLYAALQKHDLASVAYSKFLQQYPDDDNVPDAMLSLANSQIALKKSADAKKTLQTLSKRFPKSDAGKAAVKQLKSFK